MQLVQGDSSSAWLRQGLIQLLSSDLACGMSVQVVPPDRVRWAASRAGYGIAGGLSPDDALALGRRLGATWVVTGGLSHGDTTYVLDVSVRDAASGKLVRLAAVMATNLLSLSDAAASQILQTLRDGQAPHPQLASVDR